MSTINPSTPPFAPPRTTDQRIEPWSDRHPMLLVVAAFGVGVLAALVVGLFAGFSVYSVSMTGCYDDGWCELGAALYGLLVGCAAGAVAHITAGAFFIRRHRAAGRRAVPMMLHVGVPIMLFGLLLASSGF